MAACAAAVAAAAAGGGDDDHEASVSFALLAADPRHMLSYVHPGNFEVLAVAAEVIAQGKKIERVPPLHRLHFE